ncbi:hypothetical protein NOS3756_59250 (plasmid) [Nostoc sp. NIES-3756]|uniref:hypothetical protein n=1 Tax=Nostoc sp. NIES-3756 TaxID=1751286 RepID=UPI000721BE3F|nr:hypothetical protein [Nostoc sp. NIES-3756]BAT56913.1 hypothetical protein NOS3756_59250 [Nostoc sp. NIES-3756]
MFRSHTWLAPLVLSLVSFSSVEKAIAQTTLPFNANYDTLNTLEFIPNTPGILKAVLSGESTDANYGLTQVTGLTYGQFDSNTGIFRFNTDPTAFGLQGFSQGFVKLFGSNNDSLIGSDELTGLTDFQNLIVTATGVFNITGGEGKFRGASGTLDLFEFDQLDPNFDLTQPIRGRVTVSGSFQITPVPEPSYTTTLVGLFGVGVLWRAKRRGTERISQSNAENF